MVWQIIILLEKGQNILVFTAKISTFTVTKTKVKGEIKCLVKIWKDSCTGRTIQPRFHSPQRGTNNSPSSWHEAMCTLLLFRVQKWSVRPWEGAGSKRWDSLSHCNTKKEPKVSTWGDSEIFKSLVTDKEDRESGVWLAYSSELFYDETIYIIIIYEHIKALLGPHNTFQQTRGNQGVSCTVNTSMR